jgi:drug/metabolite transporter (DMT)-like permease
LPALDHRRAVALMIVVTLLWSSAGVVTRHLDAARGFETTFWRSAFNVLALVALLSWWRGPGVLWRTLAGASRALWISGLCWCAMFTAFMVALTMTTVANVLITMATAPLLTALMARIALGHRVAPRTWAAIAAAGVGIGWMFGQQAAGGDARHLLGTLVAAAVPLAAAVNWTLLQHLKGRDIDGAQGDDMLVAVLLGALLSCAITLPLAVPLQATVHDVTLLGLLGVFQLAVPCLLAVVVARVLPAPEISLLALLEVVFGVLWAWLGAGEAPSASVLGGGLLVLGALVANELARLRPGPGRAEG